VNKDAVESGSLAEHEVEFNQNHDHHRALVKALVEKMRKVEVLDLVDELLRKSKTAKAQILIDLLRERERREE
jgi:transposase